MAYAKIVSGFELVGLTGLEPVTLRLSSACSNQLSYRPWSVPASARGPVRGDNRARTGNILLAKQVLYQLSYIPGKRYH